MLSTCTRLTRPVLASSAFHSCANMLSFRVARHRLEWLTLTPKALTNSGTFTWASSIRSHLIRSGPVHGIACPSHILKIYFLQL